MAILLVALALELGSALSLRADHCADDAASGEPERSLAGIRLSNSKVKDLIEVRGQPTRVERAAGSATFIWENGSLKTSVGVTYEGYDAAGNMVDELIYSVDVSGTKAGKGVGTGRGLQLGDKIESLDKIYGSRHREVTHPPRRRTLAVCWSDDTELEAEIDEQGRIVRLSLVLSLE